jgi:hypothetical protein
MTMTIKGMGARLACAAVLTSALGGCSMAQLEEFNADLNDYGLVYEDMGPQEQRLPCARGGTLVAVSRLIDNRQHTSVVNRGRSPARVQVLVGGEVIRNWSLSPGRESEAYVHSPNLTVEFETTC